MTDVLTLGTNVVVACVIPSADVQSGDVLASLERRVSVWTHPSPVEVLRIRRRLASIVEV